MTDTQVSFNDLIGSDSVTDSDKLKKKTRNSNKKSPSSKKEVPKKKSTSSTASSKKTVAKKTSVKKVSKNSSKKIGATSRKNTVKGRNSKVNVTQEDMDKLCEVYDWYLQMKDLNIIDKKSSSIKSSVILEDDIIKSKKRISSIVDEAIWDDFSRLCENTGLKKGDVLTFAIKEFLLKHKDLI